MSRLEQLEKMLATEPKDVFLNFGRAMELVKDGRQADALAQFDRVTELDPSYITAYFQKAKLLVQTGDRAGAKAAIQAGIEQAVASGDTHAKSEMEEYLATL